MILSEQARVIAIQLGKSENMRIAAGRMFAEAWEYITTPGTDGAKQLSDAGYPITQKALWGIIRTDPSFPAKLGTSWATAQRVLAIGQSPDPEEDDKKKRAAQAKANAKRDTQAKADAANSSSKSHKDAPSPLQYTSSEEVKCNSTASSDGDKCDSQFDEFMKGGGAQAPSSPQATAAEYQSDSRIEDIINFLSARLEDDEMPMLGKMLEGICDPLSRALLGGSA